MQQDDNCDANSNRSPEHDQGGAARRFQPSAKLMDKMKKLAGWRIDRSLIEFPKDAPKFHGGHATVLRAFLNPPSSKGGKTDDFVARDHAGQEVVAVKTLNIPDDRDLERVLGVRIDVCPALVAVGTESLQLALREVGFLVELLHPQIVELEGFVEDVSEGIIWLVFPWEANGNLRDFVASHDWEIPERISLIYDVAKGVEYLHSQNPPICHGDLKSVNILVNSNCRALITDFGSARLLTEAGPAAETREVGNERQRAAGLHAAFCASTNTITLTGNEFTLRWAAPELLNDEPPTVKVDIWALGWISYEVMTNAIPFEDVRKDTIVIKRVIQGDLPSITGDTRMSLMLKLCSLMSECWSTDPSQRPTAMVCRKSLSWMPMIVPSLNRTTAATVPSPQLLLRLGEMHQQQGDYVSASKFYTEALDIFTDAADKRGRADALYGLAGIHRLQGKAEEAVTFYSDALEIITSIGDRKRKARALWGIARTYVVQDKYSQAATSFSDALKINTEINSSQGKALALFGLADVHRVQKEYTQAIQFYSDALQFFTGANERQGRASALWGLAEAHRQQNEHTQAITFYSDALRIYTEIGDIRGRAFTLVGLARVNSGQGRHNGSIDLYEQAAKIYEQIGDARLSAVALEGAADARRRLELD